MPNHILTEVEEMAASTLCEYVLTIEPQASGYYCKHCASVMHPSTTPAGEPTLTCGNVACQWTISAVDTVIAEVFAADGKLARIVKLMASSGCSYDLALLALADCCGVK